jgi:hypothetical protein
MSHVDELSDSAAIISPGCFCIPPLAKLEQLRRVAINYMQDHPADLRFSPALLIMQSLHGAFPCEKGNPGPKPPVCAARKRPSFLRPAPALAIGSCELISAGSNRRGDMCT